ncbi:MAG: hypothetical protein SFV81_11665, partial [Pirellulaceae bacterium]|nr:hypothetical protein [Pirellulaceae bacterium]
SLLLLFSLDQHRFQPWAYELGLFCVIWLGCREPSSMQLMRVLLISVYLYSALGKLDFEFLHTVGQQMLAVVVGTVGVDPQDLSPSARLGMVAVFPCIELAAAIGLVWTRTRPFAGWLAIGVHLGLVVILGPLGLNHRLGVLVWNVQVALQAYWLFVAGQGSAKPTESPKPSVAEPSVAKPSVAEPSVAGATKRSWSEWLVTTAIGAAVALPSTERLGLWDHWPSWALYAPHSSRVYLEIAAPAVERLPADLRSLVQEPPADSEEVVLWLAIPMDAWSLKTLDTPIYPQARFQLGVAEKIALDMNAGFQARITVLGISSRFTGVRRTTVYDGLPQLTKARQPYWINHHPRSHLKAP